MHVVEGYRAERRHRHGPRPRRLAHLRARRQQLQQPLRRAGRLRDLAPHLGQLGNGTRGEHGIEHELAEPAAGDLPTDHQPRSEPQDTDDARHDERDGNGREAGAGEQARAGSVEGALGGGREPARDVRLLAEGVHGAHGAQVLRGVGRGIRQTVLGRARQATHGSAVGQQRKDDHRDGRQPQGCQRRAGHEHHGQRADQHDQVAQRLAESRAGRPLDLRGVGRQAAHHLAGVGLVVEGRTQRGQVPEHVGAQIGDDALAQPVDGVHAARACHRQHQADADERDEVAVDEAAVMGREPDVDHAPDGQRHCQHGGGGSDQGDQGRQHHAQVAPQIRAQSQQRRQLAPAQGRGRSARIGFRQGAAPQMTYAGGRVPTAGG